MRHFTVDLPCALRLNYSEFPNSCLLCQLSVRINLLICSLIVGSPTSYNAAIIFCVNQIFSSSYRIS